MSNVCPSHCYTFICTVSGSFPSSVIGHGITQGSPGHKKVLKDDLTFRMKEFSKDPSYGYTDKNPGMGGGMPDKYDAVMKDFRKPLFYTLTCMIQTL